MAIRLQIIAILSHISVSRILHLGPALTDLRMQVLHSRKVGEEKVGGVTHGGMHVVAARLGCQSAMVGTGWQILALAACTGLENTTLTLGSFLEGRLLGLWASV